MKNTISGIAISKIIGFVVFLFLIAIASFFEIYIDNNIYSQVLDFLIANLFLSFLIMIMTLIAEIFWRIDFPFNLAGPVLSAVASIFIVAYIIRLFELIFAIYGIEKAFSGEALISLVFWMVLIIGYLILFLRFFKKGRKDDNQRKKRKSK